MAADGLLMASSHKTVNLQYHGVLLHVTSVTAHHFASEFETLPVTIIASAFYKGDGGVPKLYSHRFSSCELAGHPVFVFVFC